MEKTKVFVSYAHESDAHRNYVYGLAASLRQDGFAVILDIEKETSEDWPLWMHRQLKVADFVLCICTKEYHTRSMQEGQPNMGMGVGWEAALIRILLYENKLNNTNFIPVCPTEADLMNIPLYLRGGDRFVLDSDEGYTLLIRKLTQQPRFRIAEVEEQRPQLQTTAVQPLFRCVPDTNAIAPASATASAIEVSASGPSIIRPPDEESADEESLSKLQKEVEDCLQDNSLRTWLVKGSQENVSLTSKAWTELLFATKPDWRRSSEICTPLCYVDRAVDATSDDDKRPDIDAASLTRLTSLLLPISVIDGHSSAKRRLADVMLQSFATRESVVAGSIMGRLLGLQVSLEPAEVKVRKSVVVPQGIVIPVDGIGSGELKKAVALALQEIVAALDTSFASISAGLRKTLNRGTRICLWVGGSVAVDVLAELEQEFPALILLQADDAPGADEEVRRINRVNALVRAHLKDIQDFLEKYK